MILELVQVAESAKNVFSSISKDLYFLPRLESNLGPKKAIKGV